MGRRPRKTTANPITTMLVECGLDPSEWKVSFYFTKGAIAGGRGVVVEVTHVPTKRVVAKESWRATTKRDARSKVLPLVRSVVGSLQM